MDNAEAVHWYRAAAEQDYAEAQYRLGECYYYGIGVKKDLSEALIWMNRAKKNDNWFAACFLKKHMKGGRLV